MATRLTDAERAALAQTLPGWSLVEGRDAIVRELPVPRLQRGLGVHEPRRAAGGEPEPSSRLVERVEPRCGSNYPRTTPAG